MARDSFFKTAAPLVVLTFVGVYNFPPITEEEIAARNAVEQSVHYGGCNEVRAAGNSPLYCWDPAMANIWTAMATVSRVSLIAATDMR